jgi:NAD(P)-dependent dehydrogenase (short-subunit alcohol dehydrogenase family)
MSFAPPGRLDGIRLHGPENKERHMGQLDGKTCVVTGSASGIGQQMAVALAREGATVVAVARDAARTTEAINAIKQLSGSAKVEGVACDLASLASVKTAGAELKQRFPKIDLLVNNAAVFNGSRRTSKDGFELGFAVNNLAPFLLTQLLLDSLKAAASSRVVMMTMPTKTPVNFDDLQAEKSYSALKTLEMTKGCEQYVVKELAKRLQGSNVSVVAVNPGLTQSKLPTEAPLPLRLVFKLFGKTPEQGAKVPLSACLDTKWQSGQFVDDKGKLSSYPAFIDDASAARLWEVNSKLCGLQ